MARLPRLTVPGFPHHIIQRGNNRQPIFVSEVDYRLFIALLEEHARAAKVAVHAYVLMPNLFHVLATPEAPQGIPLLMQSVGRRYARHFNQAQSRTGTLWEGRYRSTVIQAERYLLACMVYLDLGPVRDGLVPGPSDYPWSSHLHYVGASVDRCVTPHPVYWQLGNTPFAREVAYAERVRAGLPAQQQIELQDSALKGWALGDQDFVADLQKRTARRVVKASAGRPPGTGKHVPNFKDGQPLRR
jgi:putative transposase